MATRVRCVIAWLFLVLMALAAPNADAQEHWVATWAASPQSPRFSFPRFPAPTAQPNNSQPAPAAPAPPAPGNPPPAPLFPAPPTIDNQTVRMIVHTSIGGHRVRVQLSNAFGTSSLQLGAAHIALHDKDSTIVAGSDHALTFSGRTSAVIPPGAEMLSDPLDFEVPALGDLVISLYVPVEASTPTIHLTGLHTTYISQLGDFTGSASIADPTTRELWYWIAGVDVVAPVKSAAIVAFGDSITDGATSTPNTNSSWPSQLAVRLAADKSTANLAVVNEGISGNRLLNDAAGVSALARFDRDVLSQPGVKWLIVLEGINDIGIGGLPGAPATEALSADDLIAAHKQIIERAHMHGIKVIGATLTPYVGAAYATDRGETLREAVNKWILASNAYDAVIDFDAAVQDPSSPRQIRPSYNIRDHLHPNDEGYKAMAAAIDLRIFKSK
ncbi:MAG TPA: SGNH/GDSL hydrolase family protein [Candidatus Acidoferrales bacterium]|jgi:lysophospholipase L1-like esterase|nr:SGNH/GDSL hydrolase family protein [Candidatus Acidoferrales bacterium]